MMRKQKKSPWWSVRGDWLWWMLFFAVGCEGQNPDFQDRVTAPLEQEISSRYSPFEEKIMAGIGRSTDRADAICRLWWGAIYEAKYSCGVALQDDPEGWEDISLMNAAVVECTQWADLSWRTVEGRGLCAGRILEAECDDKEQAYFECFEASGKHPIFDLIRF